MEKDICKINDGNITYGRGYVYSLQYHIVWCTKYRKQVLKNGLDERHPPVRPGARENIFFILGVVFIVVGLSLVLQDDRILLFEIPLIFGAIVYAVVSSFQIGRQERG